MKSLVNEKTKSMKKSARELNYGNLFRIYAWMKPTGKGIHQQHLYTTQNKPLGSLKNMRHVRSRWLRSSWTDHDGKPKTDIDLHQIDDKSREKNMKSSTWSIPPRSLPSPSLSYWDWAPGPHWWCDCWSPRDELWRAQTEFIYSDTTRNLYSRWTDIYCTAGYWSQAHCQSNQGAFHCQKVQYIAILSDHLIWMQLRRHFTCWKN